MGLKLTDLTVDPEFEKLFIGNSEEAKKESIATRARLVTRIKKDEKFTDSIKVWANKGIIVDGMTRYSIWANELECSEDIYPEIIELRFKDRAEVIQWMKDTQFARRNMSQSQHSMYLAEKVASGEMSQREAATNGHVSRSSLGMAASVIKTGTDELKDAVKDGTIAVSDAAKVANLPAKNQNEAVKAVREKTENTAAQAAKTQATPAEREPGDESNPDSETITKLATKFVADVVRLQKVGQQLFNAIDAKKLSSKEFANRHKGYEKRMRALLEAIDPVHAQAKELIKAWESTRKQIEG